MDEIQEGMSLRKKRRIWLRRCVKQMKVTATALYEAGILPDKHPMLVQDAVNLIQEIEESSWKPGDSAQEQEATDDDG